MNTVDAILLGLIATSFYYSYAMAQNSQRAMKATVACQLEALKHLNDAIGAIEDRQEGVVATLPMRGEASHAP